MVHAEHAVPARAAAERAAPWIGASIAVLPLLAGRYPPMIDLPCHEEIVAAMRHFGDASRYPPGLMRWNLGHPNQLFYFLAAALSFVWPVDVACKLVVGASVAGVPLGAGRLAHHLGVSRRVAIAVAPLALGFFFYFGFVGNVLALGLLLASLPELDRLARAPTPGRAAGAALVLLVLYLAHDSALVIGGLSVAVLSLGRPLLRPATAWRAAPLAVVGALGFDEELYALRYRGSNLRALPQVIELGFEQKWDGVPQALLGLHGADAVRPVFWASMTCIVLLATHRALGARAPLRAAGVKGWLDAHRFLCLGVALVVAYFEVPFAFGGAMWLHARFLGPAVAVLAVSLAPRSARRPAAMARLAYTASGVAGSLMLLLVRRELGATSAVYADLDPLLGSIQPGSAIAPLDVVGAPLRGLTFTVAGAAARAAAERGGRMAASFTQASPIPPVVVAPEHRWEESFFRLSRDTLSLEPARDFHRFRYALAWTLPGQDGPLARAVAPEARLVARSGGWLLFESTLSLDSVLSPEPEGAASETVRSRLEAGPNP